MPSPPLSPCQAHTPLPVRITMYCCPVPLTVCTESNSRPAVTSAHPEIAKCMRGPCLTSLCALRTGVKCLAKLTCCFACAQPLSSTCIPTPPPCHAQVAVYINPKNGSFPLSGTSGGGSTSGSSSTVRPGGIVGRRTLSQFIDSSFSKGFAGSGSSGSSAGSGFSTQGLTLVASKIFTVSNLR